MPDEEIDVEKEKRSLTVGKAEGKVLSSEAWEGFDADPYKEFPGRSKRLLNFYLMQQFDPTIGAAVYIIRRMLINAIGEYHHEQEGIKQFITDALANIEGGFQLAVSRLLTAPVFGVATLEKLWGRTENRWTIDRLELLHPLTYARELYEGSAQAIISGKKEGIALDKQTQRVEEVTQYSGKISEAPVTHKIANLVYWPYNAQFREDVYGNSILEKARRSWYAKVKMEAYWAVLMEKYAVPIPIMPVPEGYHEDPVTGEPVTNALWFANFFEELVAGQALTIEMGTEEMAAWKDSLQLLESKAGAAADFDRACRYFDGQLFKAVMMPRLLLEEPEHATRAQAEVNLEFFNLMLQGIQDELNEVLVQQIVAPMVLYNFGEAAGKGEWQAGSFKDDDMELMAQVLLLVRQAQAFAMQAGVDDSADMAKARTGWASDLLANPEEVVEFQQAATERGTEEAEEVLSAYG